MFKPTTKTNNRKLNLKTNACIYQTETEKGKKKKIDEERVRQTETEGGKERPREKIITDIESIHTGYTNIR